MPNRDDVLADEEAGLDEFAAPAPDENPDEQGIYHHDSLEARRSRPGNLEETQIPQGESKRTAEWMTQLYIVSYLIFFSIFGVLARIGLQALTVYPGALITNTDLWANFGGSLLMGILREDRMLFRRNWKLEVEKVQHEAGSSLDNSNSEQRQEKLNRAARKAFASSKGSIPVYIGLTVGFCGSFTSFASICRDAFLAIANSVDTTV